MEQREKLMKLIREFLIKSYDGENMADYLIANGVVVLPCRCCECKHCEIGQNDVEQWCICTLRFGKHIDVDPTDFCSYGERKGGGE